MVLGVFFFRICEIFVENFLVDVCEFREIFMIIGGMYYIVIMLFVGFCSDYCGKNCRLKCNFCDKSIVYINFSSFKISEYLEVKFFMGYM